MPRSSLHPPAQITALSPWALAILGSDSNMRWCGRLHSRSWRPATQKEAYLSMEGSTSINGRKHDPCLSEFMLQRWSNHGVLVEALWSLGRLHKHNKKHASHLKEAQSSTGSASIAASIRCCACCWLHSDPLGWPPSEWITPIVGRNHDHHQPWLSLPLDIRSKIYSIRKQSNLTNGNRCATVVILFPSNPNQFMEK